MIYFFNKDLKLEQGFIIGYGSVDFLRSMTGDQIIVLDAKALPLVKEALLLGSIDIDALGNVDKILLKQLEFEGVFIPTVVTKQLGETLYTDKLNFWLQVTDQCNLSCSYCYIPSLNSKKDLRDDIFELLSIKLCKVSGLKDVYIKLAGGEPLLAFQQWKNGVIGLRNALEQNGIHLHLRIISNLTVLTNEMISFIKENQVEISVSLDGLSGFNDKNRIYTNGKGSFEIVKKHLDLLKSHGVQPSIMITATSDNKDGIPELIEYLVINDFTFRIADAKGGDIKPHEFDAVIRTSSSVIAKAIDSGFPVSSRVVFSDLRTLSPQSTPCSMGRNAAAIYLDGSVYFCHTEFEKGKAIGHLQEEEDLITIIHRGKQKHYGLSEDCQTCEYRLVCAGGCPLYRENGKSPMCASYKNVIAQVYKLYGKESDKIKS